MLNYSSIPLTSLHGLSVKEKIKLVKVRGVFKKTYPQFVVFFW